MAEEHYVIVGNGPAANQAAVTLRDNAPEARFTVIGAPACSPINSPSTENE